MIHVVTPASTQQGNDTAFDQHQYCRKCRDPRSPSLIPSDPLLKVNTQCSNGGAVTGGGDPPELV